jgi:inosine-uridine nucleoside N-ribohydrolase
MERKRLWMDVDPAIGVRYRDLDDGLAVLFMIASPEVSLEGLSIIFGNVKADRGYEVARELLEVADADVPFYKGAANKKELGKSSPAAEALVKKVSENPGEISLLATGPLTNVATAMILDPEFAKNLRELVVMGGSLRFKPFSYFGEFNFHLDAKAASMVMSAPIPKTLITMDVCAKAVFTQKHLDMIKQRDTRVARYLAKTIPSWLRLNTIMFRQEGFYPWDVVAAAHLIDESLFDKNPRTFSVQEEGIRRGSIHGLVKRESFEEINGVFPVNVPRKLDGEAFMKLFLDRLLSI